MRATISDRDYEILSAYMDGQLSSRETNKLEERLRARPDLRTALEEMQRMRALLRSAPRRRAPRNFTLTPAMVGERKPRTSPWAGLFPVLSFTSAVAALLLVVVLTMHLGPGSQAPQTVAMQEPQLTAEMRTMEEAPAAPEAAPQEQAEEPAAGAAPAEPEVPAAKSPGEQTTEEVTALMAPTEAAAEQEAPAEPAATEAPAAEEPAATEAPAEEAPAPQPTPTLDQSLMASGEGEATLPPVVNWAGVPGVAAGPPATGMGGAGDIGIMGGPGMGGMGGGPDGRGGGADNPPGAVYLPPESVVEESGAAEEPAAPDVTATAAPTPAAPAEDAALSGTGPILGVPAPQEGGQITDRDAFGDGTVTEAPAGEEPAPAAEPTEAAAPTATAQPSATPQAVAEAPQQEAPLEEQSQDQFSQENAPQPGPAVETAREAEPTVLGMDPQTVVALEIALGLIALAAGGAAFYLWRRRSLR